MSNFFKNLHPLLRRGRDKYDNTNFAVLNALNYELSEMEKETIESRIQSSLKSATGEYLDKWGDWFGLYRREGESDDKYRARIIKYLLLKRGTIPAIIDALKDFLDDYDANIEIYEPWKNIFYTNKSNLNGEDHLMGFYYRFAIIDISIDRPFPPEIIEVIQAFKPAGVLFYVNYDYSLNKNKAQVIDSAISNMKVVDWQELDSLNGVTDILNGVINLSDRDLEKEDRNIFHTNNSDLNGLDVLSGSFSSNRKYFNLITSSKEDFIPNMDTSFTDMKLSMTELDNSFYQFTDKIDNLSAIQTINMESDTSFYFTYNVSDSLNYKYKSYLDKINPSGSKTNKDYSMLMSNPTLSSSFKSLVGISNPINYTISIFDFVTNKWHVILEDEMTSIFTRSNINIQATLDYLNNNHLLFVKLTVVPKEQPYDLYLNMLRLEFRNKFDNKNTINYNYSIEEENTISVTMDFKNKITDNFTNPNSYMYGVGTSLLLPNYFANELIDGNPSLWNSYSSLFEVDNSYVVHTTSKSEGGIAQQMAKFDVISMLTSIFPNIKNLSLVEKLNFAKKVIISSEVEAYAKGTGIGGNKVTIKQAKGTRWDGIASNTSNEIKSIGYKFGENSATYYLNNDGFMYVLLHSEPSDGGTIYSECKVDYISLYLKIKNVV